MTCSYNWQIEMKCSFPGPLWLKMLLLYLFNYKFFLSFINPSMLRHYGVGVNDCIQLVKTSASTFHVHVSYFGAPGLIWSLTLKNRLIQQKSELLQLFLKIFYILCRDRRNPRKFTEYAFHSNFKV